MEKEFEQNIETEASDAVVTAHAAESNTVKETAAPVVAKSNKRVLVGKVKSNKADKTIVIAVVRQVAHPLYKKYFKRTKKFMAHDELNQCGIGDTVKIRECRPMSARKRWELVEIVERAK